MGFCFGTEAYLTKDVPILKNNKAIGTAKILSKVEVLQDNGKELKVQLNGVISDNYQEEIVKSPTQNESFAVFWNQNEKPTFKGDINPYIKLGNKIEDEYGEFWHQASITFFVNKSDITNDPDSIYKEAKNLYEQTCSACHRLHDTTSFTTNQWPSNVESMIGAGYVDLAPRDKALILKYLQENSKDATKGQK